MITILSRFLTAGARLGVLAVLLPSVACATKPTHIDILDADFSDKPLTVHATTRLASAPARVLVRTRVDPDPRNRALTLAWWTADWRGGSHLITLEGDRAPLWHHFTIKHLEAGQYSVSALLERSDDTVVRRRTTIRVVGAAGEDFQHGASMQ